MDISPPPPPPKQPHSTAPQPQPPAPLAIFSSALPHQIRLPRGRGRSSGRHRRLLFHHHQPRRPSQLAWMTTAATTSVTVAAPFTLLAGADLGLRSCGCLPTAVRFQRWALTTTALLRDVELRPKEQGQPETIDYRVFRHPFAPNPSSLAAGHRREFRAQGLQWNVGTSAAYGHNRDGEIFVSVEPATPRQLRGGDVTVVTVMARDLPGQRQQLSPRLLDLHAFNTELIPDFQVLGMYDGAQKFGYGGGFDDSDLSFAANNQMSKSTVFAESKLPEDLP